jgi:deoxyribodipyrimidine photolyase-related protein
VTDGAASGGPREANTSRMARGRGKDRSEAGPGGGRLIAVLGDQLDARSLALEGIDAARDTILMMEVAEESEHVPSHVQRTALFLSAMRHFAAELEQRGLRVRYVRLTDAGNTGSFGGELARAIAELRPELVRVVEPGEHRVRAIFERAAREAGVALEVVEDRHFLTTREEFAAWAKGRKAPLVMENFYRWQRERLGILMEGKGKPVGGAWNFDKDNRESFGKSGPSPRPRAPVQFEPDEITRQVIADVRARLGIQAERGEGFEYGRGLPGRVESFGWPVTRAQALDALEDFVAHRLAKFGQFEDAMWTGEPVLYHSTLSAAMNLKLLDPRECVDAAVRAFERGKAELRSVEGFVRQIIGWREFVRGVYFFEGPGYAERNSMGHERALPEFLWTGKADMNCLRECVGQVVERGFGHHIQRLMVVGNFALLAGVHAKKLSDWFLGMYVDGVEWATLPNVLGMSQHADARPGERQGVVGTKPYISGGNYLSKMSNYCAGCRYDPSKRTGDKACPFTAMYWDFLNRHRERLSRNPRVGPVLRSIDRFSAEELTQITITARRVRERVGIEPPGRAKSEQSARDRSTR